MGKEEVKLLLIADNIKTPKSMIKLNTKRTQ